MMARLGTGGYGWRPGAVLAGLTVAASTAQADVIYVNGALFNGGNDGSSWFDAFRGPTALQDALDAASPGDEIWVAQGTYHPSDSGDRAASFQLQSGVALFGGFFGIETERDQRAPAFYVSTLSGDLGAPNDQADNSFHVVNGSGVDQTAWLDGFTIRDGNTEGAPFLEEAGGGIYVSGGSPTIVGCTVTANRSFRTAGGILLSQGADAFISDCVIDGNLAGGSVLNIEGGGLAIFHSSPQITGCLFSQNSAGYGGAIHSYQSGPAIAGCQFQGNSSYVEGGAINVVFDGIGGTVPALSGCTFLANSSQGDGGAVLTWSADTEVSNCSFDENAVFGDHAGGAIHVRGGDPTIEGCAFDDNTATGDGLGGAIGLEGGNPAVDGCTFTSNQAHKGGAIYAQGGAPRISGCTFTLGWAAVYGGGLHTLDSSARVVGCQFLDNSSNLDGGGAYTTGGSPVFVSCLFQLNTTGDGGWGGGLFNNGAVDGTVANCMFRWNQARRGGGLYQWQSQTLVDNCTLNGNHATGSDYTGGGGLRIYEGDVSVANTIIWGNTTNADPASAEVGNLTPLTATFYACDIKNSGGSSSWDAGIGVDGGGNLDVDPQFDPSLGLSPCSPVIDGGDLAHLPADLLDLDGDGDVSEPLSLDLAGNPRVLGGQVDPGAYEAAVSGGAEVLYVNASIGDSGDGTSWATAFAELQEALAVAAGDPAVEQVWVAAGTYRPDGGPCDDLDDATLSFRLVDGVEILGGFAGGETSPGQRDPDANETTLTGELGNDDNPDNSDHVVTAQNVGPTAVLSGFTIERGDGSGPSAAGAGLLLQAASPTIERCTFRDNQATNGGAVAGDGHPATDPTFVDCTFQSNSASLTGGAVSGVEQGAFFDCVFLNNVAGTGGAFWHSTADDTVIFARCTFKANHATTGHGGAIASVDGGDVAVTGGLFLGNVSGGDGGAMRTEGSAVVTNSRFLQNLSQGWGGALRASEAADVFNCLFTGNHAGDHGGAVFASGQFSLVNSTVHHNTSDSIWGGVVVNPNTVALVTNCVLWDNQDAAGSSLDAQIVNDGGLLLVVFSCVEHWDGSLGGVGNFGDDPMFANAAGGDGSPGTFDDDLRLLPGSPCIDAGDDSSLPPDVTTDLDGNARFVGAAVDLGPYEHGAACEGDADGDGSVGVLDLSAVLLDWGTDGSASNGDVDGSGLVDVLDLTLIIQNWGVCP